MKNVNIAEEIFHKAIRHLLGIGVDKNLILAKKCLRESSDYGYTDAINLLADLYIRKELYSKDYNEAIQLYEQGCKLGNPRSLFHLANCYAKGKGVKTDVTKAIELYKQAYEAGCPDACFELALCYKKGKGVEHSIEQAIDWYRKGFNMGDAACACNLGFCYYSGEGIQKDWDKAREILLKYSNYNAVVQRNIGVIYYKGTSTCSPDEDKAIYWFKESANNGNAKAMIFLGKIFRERENYKIALDWYKLAAETDGKEGAYQYGFFLYKFQGQEEWDTSFTWIKKAAENKYVDAAFMLGLFYKCGVGTTVDHAKAFYWFNIAAENGCEQAYSHIGRYYRDGRIVTKNYETALVWFEKAISSKDDNVRGEALYDYGIMYLEGLGVALNRDKAIAYLLESKELECINAINKLREFEASDLKPLARSKSHLIKNANIIEYVKMKTDDGNAQCAPNAYKKLMIYIDIVKGDGIIEDAEGGLYKWKLSNKEFAQWILMVSDDLNLYWKTDQGQVRYHPTRFAKVFITKKNREFRLESLRHDMSAINTCSTDKEVRKIDLLMSNRSKAKKEISALGL